MVHSPRLWRVPPAAIWRGARSPPKYRGADHTHGLGAGRDLTRENVTWYVWSLRGDCRGFVCPDPLVLAVFDQEILEL